MRDIVILLNHHENNTSNLTSPEKVRETMTSLVDAMKTLASTAKENQTKSLDLPTANIQYTRLPDLSYWLPTGSIKQGDKSRLLGFASRRIRKRAFFPAIIVFAWFDLDLSQWIHFYPKLKDSRKTKWLPTNYSQFYPSEHAPYVNTQVFRVFDNISLPAAPKFLINMTGRLFLLP